MSFPALEAAVRAARLNLDINIKAKAVTASDVVACENLIQAWEPGKYTVGDTRNHADQVWKCVQAHDNTANPDVEPGKTPAIWVPYHTTDPARAKAFIQPTMAEDSYMKDECCVWTDGKTYRSTMASANAYSPKDYPQGWEVVK